MAYFLKKCVKKGRVYLSIVNGYHDPKRGHAVQVTYKSFGTGSGLLEQGITDPVAYCEELVKKLNFEDNRKKCEEVTDRAPIKFGGHFLVNAVLNKLGVKDFIDILSLTTNYQFSLYDVFCALLFSRIIKPCSKYQTFNEVIPYLDKQYSFSYDQLLSGLSYFGDEDDLSYSSERIAGWAFAELPFWPHSSHLLQKTPQFSNSSALYS